MNTRCTNCRGRTTSPEVRRALLIQLHTAANQTIEALDQDASRGLVLTVAQQIAHAASLLIALDTGLCGKCASQRVDEETEAAALATWTTERGERG